MEYLKNIIILKIIIRGGYFKIFVGNMLASNTLLICCSVNTHPKALDNLYVILRFYFFE
jgi:hypothetical protein